MKEGWKKGVVENYKEIVKPMDRSHSWIARINWGMGEVQGKIITKIGHDFDVLARL